MILFLKSNHFDIFSLLEAISLNFRDHFCFYFIAGFLELTTKKSRHGFRFVNQKRDSVSFLLVLIVLLCGCRIETFLHMTKQLYVVTKIENMSWHPAVITTAQ